MKENGIMRRLLNRIQWIEMKELWDEMMRIYRWCKCRPSGAREPIACIILFNYLWNKFSTDRKSECHKSRTGWLSIEAIYGNKSHIQNNRNRILLFPTFQKLVHSQKNTERNWAVQKKNNTDE